MVSAELKTTSKAKQLSSVNSDTNFADLIPKLWIIHKDRDGDKSSHKTYYLKSSITTHAIPPQASLTWKSQFCSKVCHPWKSTSRWGCSCTHSTARTRRATRGPTRSVGSGPGWASRTRRSAPSSRRASREPRGPAAWLPRRNTRMLNIYVYIWNPPKISDFPLHY